MANQVYSKFVLETKFEDMYESKIRMNDYLDVDDTLTRNEGDTLKVNVYGVTGQVDDVTMGQGNTHVIETAYRTENYTVKKTQGKGVYYDEEYDKDPAVVDALLQGLAAKMANKSFAEAFDEFDKSYNWVIATNLDFDAFCDAVALLNIEGSENLFALIAPADEAEVRKQLKTALSYNEAFVRTGYIGSVNGIPLVVTKACPAGQIYIATKEAVKNVYKRGTEIEYERDADLRKNSIYIRKTNVVALQNADKLVKITKYPTALITKNLHVSSKASTTSGSTVLVVPAAPKGFKWNYKAGTSEATVTLGTALVGFTGVTAEETTIAMSTNTHLTVALAGATDDKPVAKIDLTGDTLVIG